MLPKWFDLANIPYEKMWVDDKIWLPLYLEKKKFKGSFLLKGMDEILCYKIDELENEQQHPAWPGS